VSVDPDPEVDPDLADEVAVVTGGTRGIGRAIARRLASAGATTVATYHEDDDAAAATERALAAVDATTAVRRFDVGDSEAVRSNFEAVRETHGTPSILVNNAGVMENGTLVRMSDEQWGDVVRTNLTGAFYCTRAALRGMLRGDGGRVVNVASVAAERGWSGQANYAASKAGLVGLTRSAAREYGDRGVRVNAVAPGFVDTDISAVTDEERVAEREPVPQDRVADRGAVEVRQRVDAVDVYPHRPVGEEIDQRLRRAERPLGRRLQGVPEVVADDARVREEESRRRHRPRSAAGGAVGDDPPAVGERRDALAERPPADAVEHEVDAVDERRDPVGDGLPLVVHAVVGAQFAGEIELLRGARRADHRGAGPARQLDGGAADASGRGVDEHALVVGQVAPLV